MADEPSKRMLTRRQVLYGGAIFGGMLALQACGATRVWRQGGV